MQILIKTEVFLLIKQARLHRKKYIYKYFEVLIFIHCTFQYIEQMYLNNIWLKTTKISKMLPLIKRHNGTRKFYVIFMPLNCTAVKVYRNIGSYINIWYSYKYSLQCVWTQSNLQNSQYRKFFTVEIAWCLTIIRVS